MKLPRFIKDKSDLAETYRLLQENYVLIRNQFYFVMSHFETYPAISWLSFSHFVDKTGWNCLDTSLKAQDVDRIFIATNFEEVD